MCRTQYLLALVTLSVGLVRSWDFAITAGEQLRFYTNDGTKTYAFQWVNNNLTAITYDEVHNMVIFVDHQRDRDLICGYNLSSREIVGFVSRDGNNIQDVTFDPATNLLFFTDTKQRSINWVSLKDPGSVRFVYGNLLIKLDRTPSNIAVDSCRGHIYWTNLKNGRRVYMERASFDGSGRQTIYRFLPVHSIAIDPQTQKNYFIEGVTVDFLNKVDLRAQNLNAKKQLIFYREHSSAQKMTVSKDYIYWISHNTVWQIPKNASRPFAIPKKIVRLDTGTEFGIAANYKIKEQIQGLQDCEALLKVIEATEIDETTYTETTAELDEATEQTSELFDTSDMEQTTEQDEETEQTAEIYDTSDMEQTTEPDGETEQITELYETSDMIQSTEVYEKIEYTINLDETSDTEHTTELDGETEQTAKLYETSDMEQTTQLDAETYMEQTTELYETSETEQTAETEVVPEYRKSYEGIACHGYCLNSGDCSLSEKSEPVCQCKGDYIGDRCEVSGCLNYCFKGTCSYNDEGHPKCRCNAGYSGQRCEVYACHGYCLNNGDCSLNTEDKPVCQCIDNYEGSRCEVVKNNFTITFQFSGSESLTLADLLSKSTANIICHG